MPETHQPTICMDFDGVMNTYTGWQGRHELFEPRENLAWFLEALHRANWLIVVHSTRDVFQLREWLIRYRLNHLVRVVNHEKPVAMVYLDDRGLTFTGTFDDQLLSRILTFKAHWEA